MKVYYPKLYSMAHLLALDVLLLPKDLSFFLFMKKCKIPLCFRLSGKIVVIFLNILENSF